MSISRTKLLATGRWSCVLFSVTGLAIASETSGTARAAPLQDPLDSPTASRQFKGRHSVPDNEPQDLQIANAMATGSAEKLVTLAKKLIVDSFPEDRNIAENLLIQAIRVDPQFTIAYADLARFVMWQISSGLREPAEVQLASNLADQVSQMDPNRPLGSYLLCEIMLALGKSTQANALFRETIAKFPSHIDSKVFEARYWSEVDPDRALTNAMDALALGHPMDDLSPAIAIAITNKQKKKSQPAGEALLRFADVYPDRWIYHRAALAFLDEGMKQEARNAYLLAIRLGNKLESRLQLGVLEYTSFGEVKAAVQHFQEALLELNAKRTKDQEALALVYSHLALAQLYANNEVASRENGVRAIEMATDYSSIVIPFVQEFMKVGKGEWIREGLEFASDKHPDNEFIHLSLAALANARKDHRAAAEHYSNSIALFPLRDDLYAARAQEHYRDKHYRFALKDFEEAIKLRSDQGNHYYNRGCMLSLLGQFPDALASLRIAFSLNPELAQTALADSDLESLRGREEFATALTELVNSSQKSFDKQQQVLTSSSQGSKSARSTRSAATNNSELNQEDPAK